MTSSASHIFDSFLSLLRAGMWQCPIDNAVTDSFSDDDWSSILKIAEAQSVTGIVADGLDLLVSDCCPPESFALQIAARTFQIEQRNRQMNAAMAKVVTALANHGLTAAILKGQGVAQLYPVPDHRQCGDVDLFFSSALARQRAADVVERDLGVSITRLALDSVNFVFDGVEFEMHTHLFDFSSRKAAALADDADVFSPFSAGGLSGFLMPSPMNQLLCLNSHIAKHALSMGIGLRQICDYALACRMYHDKIDHVRFADVMRVAGLRRWNDLLQTFIVDFLGVDEDWLPSPLSRRDPAQLLLIVKESGNFGKHRDGRKDLIKRKNTFLLKADTALHVLRNIRFAFSVAPRVTLKNTSTIIKRALMNYGK